jgi:hypothetical protein
MKSLTLFTFLSIFLINASCQNNSLLSFFPSLGNDSIFNTTEGQKTYYKMQKNSVPDNISLKYFFDIDKEKMLGTEEGYNMDTDEYFTTSYIKKVRPIFVKNIEGYSLLCYGLESMLHLDIYDPKTDKIIHSMIISDFSDEMGNIVSHSMYFPSNYIVKTEINNMISYKLIKINFDVPGFKLVKLVNTDNVSVDQNKIFEDALSALGITSYGEPIE